MARRSIGIFLCFTLIMAVICPVRAELTGQPRTSDDFVQALTPKALTNVRTRGLNIGIGSAMPVVPAAASSAFERPKVSFQVEFGFNSAILTSQATGILDNLGRALVSQNLAGYRFQLSGHTDATGKPEYNLELSKRRARAVRDYLTQQFGIDQARLTTLGYGSKQLLDPDNPGSEANRRVEIVNLGN
jgi:OOP family OmpA-OmpF porin